MLVTNIERTQILANDSTSKSWFCVFNNPEQHGFENMKPSEMLESLRDTWIEESPTRTCGLAYCISSEGLHHVHAVFEDTKTMRFSTVKKCFPAMHIESTKGTKKDAENYINKADKFAEKDEVVLETLWHGEIKGHQGKRNDLAAIGEYIEQGLSLEEIHDISFSYRRYTPMIRQAIFDKRRKEMPPKKEVSVYWHVGPSGSGKSHTQLELMDKYGRSEVYLMTDYKGGGFDTYSGEKVLFMDEFRGQLPFNELLMILDIYPNQIHARYSNSYALWTEVHITSILPPEKLYEVMVESSKHDEPLEQLLRRMTFIVYHEIVGDQHLIYEMNIRDYMNYGDLILVAHTAWTREPYMLIQ